MIDKMTSVTLQDYLRKYRVLPAIVMENADDAILLGQAFASHGLPILEITYRTSAAGAIIKRLRHEFPNLMVGAGTVLSPAQLDDAISAGAQFIVSPGLNETIVKSCQDHNISIIPGVMTATEIDRALQYGIDLVKFFPASAAGGITALQAYSGPFPSMNFLPSGGISADNVLSYLACTNVLACGGSWLAPESLISARKFTEIGSLVKSTVSRIGQKQPLPSKD